MTRQFLMKIAVEIAIIFPNPMISFLELSPIPSLCQREEQKAEFVAPPFLFRRVRG